ncbi:hypothetical protein MFIFM68171_01455 [Madurella fahalii]|uniref:Mid2 domain-containing protein n=1 Tax=Madurella fahalii TaxID=1157608 RepID=A0ABQ0G0F4_9PEZI
MRIPAGRCWLVAAALVLGTTNGQNHVTFTNLHGPNGLAIFELNATPRVFEWITLGITVDEIRLMQDIEGGVSELVANGWGSSKDSMNPPEPLPSGTPSEDLQENMKRQQGAGVLVVSSNESGGNVTITQDLVRGRAERPLFFEARWAGGESYSRVFAFADPNRIAEFARSNDATYRNDSSHRPENIHQANPTVGQPGGTGTGTGIGTGTSTSTAIVGSPSEAAGRSASGGLPLGAVIGIAVGCGIVGLAVVFALVWFLVRRHQKQKTLLPVGSYASGNRADDLIAEKEASADADASPHSPYSDDGGAAAGAPHPEGPAATVVAGALHRQHPQDQPRSFTPYSDRPSGVGVGAGAGTPSTRAASVTQTDEARISIPSPTPGRATPRALTTPYAHLVEEGMTEEEIRRLEDEERQLDAAIEQAGRR